MFSFLLPIIYLAFISLGLPDGLLGAAWPDMYVQFGVQVSAMGLVSIIISGGTIVSSLLSDRMTRAIGAGKVTAISVALTACALFGFSFSHSLWSVCLMAIPYGLGAGGVDAALNNYVALHYESRHMSWLHCMWGLGASTGPIIMGRAIAHGHPWNTGYQIVGVLQIFLTAVLIFSLPLWKTRDGQAAGTADSVEAGRALSLRQIYKIPGAPAVMITFFCYCALEQTAGQWASSYLVLSRGFSVEQAANFASLFYIGITVGRAVFGFVTIKLNDTQMIHLGLGIIAVGILVLFLPLSSTVLPGLVLVGLGCAPVYPCIIHSTPAHFGAENSQAIVGVQMASAYVGSLSMPAVFGVMTRYISIRIYPFYLLIIMALMGIMHEKMVRQTADRAAKQIY